MIKAFTAKFSEGLPLDKAKNVNEIRDSASGVGLVVD